VRTESTLRLLLLATPLWDEECPAFSLVQLASYLRARGVPVDTTILDFNLLAPGLSRFRELAPAGIHPPLFFLGDAYERRTGDSGSAPGGSGRDDILRAMDDVVDTLADVVLRYDFDVLGVTVSLASWFLVVPMLERIRARRPNTPVIAGGAHASFLAEVASKVPLPEFCRTMERTTTRLVVGEGEETFRDLVTAISDGEDLEDQRYPGSVSFVDGGMERATQRGPIRDLDSLPSPDYSAFGLESANGFDSVHIELSRGCVNRCRFCSDPGYWRGYRRRSAARVRDDLRAVRPWTRTGVVRLADSGFYPWLPGQSEILAAFRDIDPPVTWSAYTTIRGMDSRWASAMAGAGCRLVSFGVESGDDGQLARMGKRSTSADVRSAIDSARTAGLLTEASFVYGYPGESRRSLAATRALIEDLLPETRIKVFEFMPVVYSAFADELDWNRLFSSTASADSVCIGPGVHYRPPLFCDPAIRDLALEEFAVLPVELDHFPRPSGLRRRVR
jgi:radical SAM superfamily enzyme YgiQ (UPF0313 family)